MPAIRRNRSVWCCPGVFWSSRELGELAKVMKQAVEIRQELQEEHGGQETGVRVVFEREAEEFSE